MHNLINSTCKAFVDDGIAHSKREEDHLNDLALIFKRLTANRMSLIEQMFSLLEGSAIRVASFHCVVTALGWHVEGPHPGGDTPNGPCPLPIEVAIFTGIPVL